MEKKASKFKLDQMQMFINKMKSNNKPIFSTVLSNPTKKNKLKTMQVKHTNRKGTVQPIKQAKQADEKEKSFQHQQSPFCLQLSPTPLQTSYHSSNSA